MDKPTFDLRRKRTVARWLQIFGKRSPKRRPSSTMQTMGVLLMGIGVVSFALALVALLIVFIVPNLPASTSSLARSHDAAHMTAMALRNFLPGQDVQIERRFAYNLKLYVHRKPFENHTYSNRKAVMAKIGSLWCDNIGDQWLARVGVFDIVSGDRLSTHACGLDKLEEIFLR